ncbi:MAG: TolC family protein [bacterium]|nr:TolC family protein [bacterium]
MTLNDFIKKAIAQSPEIKEAYFNVDFAKARLDEAKAGHFGIIEFLGFAGVHGNARANGDQLYALDGNGNQVALPESQFLGTSDRTDSFQGFGPFAKGTLTAIVPIWTWGKLDSYKKAATAGIGVEKAGAEMKRNLVIQRIKELFYGVLLASDSMRLGDEVGEYLEKALTKANELFEEGTGEVSQTDIQRLLVGKAELARQLATAKQGEPLARSALSAFSKVSGNFDLKPDFLTEEKFKFDNLEELIAISWKHAPEANQLKYGVEAKQNLVKVEKADLYPVLFAGARFEGGASDARDTNHNPFLNDDGFGPIQGGPALGMRWNLNFLTTQAKIAQAQANYRALKSREELAKIGLPLLVEEAYRKVLEYREQIKQAEEGTKSARGWMVSASNNYEVGIGEPKILMEGIGSYAIMKINLYQARYNYNMALAKLSQTIGREVTGLEY